MSAPATLEHLAPGTQARIAGITELDERLRARMFALGLRIGRDVAVLRRAALGGPIHIRIGSTELMMRRREASLIQLQPSADAA